ncbi:energy-coupling factor transporter transmembrane component T [Propionivibrio dicarboxylicus]|uniref:Cobalt transport protein n=1 Tax=Propionivibrio dicarboxylicus TaxID=83767 RepID=A0A1G8E7H6_9RHOO|nr:energy-coupling factor transporter transmembrane component T [Propionivibrio dicarboxylicus]SDH65843.1 Cobalt transport protein [Propionivibrio dicarboxylicus]
MSRFALHPATRLIAWIALLIAVQLLSGVVLGAALVLACLAGRRIVRRGMKLLWRTRWLLASLFVILAWGTAGDPLWPSDHAPTYEGLAQAWMHIGRLLLVLMAVAAFLETMSLPDLLTATHAALAPLRRVGFDPDRGVVRLMLALRYAEDLPRPRDWTVLLDDSVTVDCGSVDIHSQRLGGWDAVVLAAIVLAGGLAVISGGSF